MSEPLDVERIYRQEKLRWLKEEAPRKHLRERIAESVPYWIILVALVLFGLSAPHTAAIFDKLTPGWGFIAPIGVEFGLLYTSFQRRLAKAAHQVLPISVWTLEILLFLTAMLVNGSGSFASVVAISGLESLSFAEITKAFGHLPATTQAALIMAVLSAFIIPIGALVAGEGLAALVLERRLGSDFREEKWREVEFTILYRAVFVRYLQQGMLEREARQRALSETKGYLGSGSSSAVRLVSAQSGQSVYPNGHKANTQLQGIKEQVRAYLEANPDLRGLSVSQVHSILINTGIQVGRTTVAEVLQEQRQVR